MTTDRQAKILQYLAEHDALEVNQLSARLEVSPSTVRRELRALQESGLLVRTHGAARRPAPLLYEPPFERRAAQQVAAKRKIAAAARRLIEPGAVVGLGGGSTCTELARQLRAVDNITVVTNAVNIALELQGQSARRVVLTGGLLTPSSYEMVGSLVATSLQYVHLNLVFVGVSGVDLGFGFSVSDEPEAVAGRAFMAAADRTIVIADHTKIGQATFARLCGLRDVHMLITDDGLTPEQRTALEQAGLQVLVAGPIAA